MREARELLEDGMTRSGMDYPLLMQGEGSRTELLERFRRLGNAVLVAASRSGKAWTCAARRCRW